jgi:hypothetical protein
VGEAVGLARLRASGTDWDETESTGKTAG